MALATWSKNDSLPGLAPMPRLRVAPCEDDQDMAWINDLSVEEVSRRRSIGNEPYVAWLDGQPVAYGWVATRTVEIGELGIEATLPDNERYLWDFATGPAWRGLGIYPRLLQAIMLATTSEATRLWIAYAPENTASASGIRKAGFQVAAEMSFRADRQVALAPAGSRELTMAGASVFGIEATETNLSPCWCCHMPNNDAHGCECDCASGAACTCSDGCGPSLEEPASHDSCACSSTEIPTCDCSSPKEVTTTMSNCECNDCRCDPCECTAMTSAVACACNDCRCDPCECTTMTSAAACACNDCRCDPCECTTMTSAVACACNDCQCDPCRCGAISVMTECACGDCSCDACECAVATRSGELTVGGVR